MKIYLVMIQDRHTDAEAIPFSTAARAVAYARKVATESARQLEDFEELEVPEDWLYYAKYSVESDCVWVVEKDLDAESN